jgi:uncharacterized protein (UPF0335 family)
MRIPAPKNAKPHEVRKPRGEPGPTTTITIGEHSASLDEVNAVVDGMIETIKGAVAPLIHKTKEYLRYDFTEAEKLRMGLELAQCTERVAQLEAEKADVDSAIKARITKASSEGSALALALNKGYEMRNLECVVAFHVPANGKKTITRTDSGEVVRVDKMDAHEMQEQLPLGESAGTP